MLLHAKVYALCIWFSVVGCRFLVKPRILKDPEPRTDNPEPPYRTSAKLARNFLVARNSVFFAVSSVVESISPIVLNFKP
jgi:hypothetical protein